MTMREFQSSSRKVFTTTDLLARSYELWHPTNRANCIHRIGHGGEFDHKGVAFNTVTAEDKKTLKHIEIFYNFSIEKMSPTPLQCCGLI